MAGLSLVTSTLVGWIAFRQTQDSIRRDALRTVGVVAESRYQTLKTILAARKQRTEAVLDYLINACEKTPATREGCQQEAIQRFVTVQHALGARLVIATRTLVAGEPLSGEPAAMPSAQLASMTQVLNGTTPRFFTIIATDPERGAALEVRYPMDEIDAIFANRYGLGQSGETFLADSHGMFATPARYPSHSGHSHPIHATPMKTCLSGVSSEMLELDYRDAPIIHGFRYVPEIGGGCIMAHIEQKEAFLPLQTLRYQIEGTTFILMIMAFFLASIISGYISKPISELVSKLQVTVRARDEFLSICSHELKTPISALKLRAQLSRRRLTHPPKEAINPEAELRDLIDAVDRQLARLNNLVDDTLDVSRISTGRLTVRPGPIDLVPVVCDAAEKMRSALAQRGCDLLIETDASVPGVWDPDRIEQVVMNLLSNAAKYAKGKPVELTVRSDQYHAWISVKDQGMGISPEHQARIFERFERVVSASEVSGLGLGLYIVRHIVEAHQGAIHVESAQGAGSTFTIKLPR